MLKQDLTIADNVINANHAVITFFVKKPIHHKSDETKQMAIKMYLESLGFRAIGRLLDVSYQAVYKWVKQLGEKHEIQPNANQEINLVALDNIHSYINKA